jgi:hypothetical protein
MYALGEGVPKNTLKAVALYRRAATAGYAKAQTSLAVAYLDGAGVKKDRAEAVRWLKKAAAQREPFAQFHLGAIYAQSGGALAQRGIELLRASADGGCVFARYSLGLAFRYGLYGLEISNDAAFRYFSLAAAQGNAASQYEIGGMYVDGSGVAKSTGEASGWFEKAAKGGHAPALAALGDIKAADGDYNAAMRRYSEAAGRGGETSLLAMDKIGQLYATGKGVAKSTQTAALWFGKAGAGGFAQAYYDLGAMYLAESRDAPSPAAVKYFTLAADRGFVQAAVVLGLIYSQGKGAPPDQQKAFAWYLKGAKAGSVFAQEETADRYLAGNGVNKSAAKAVLWYKKADDSGAQGAAAKLAEFYHGAGQDKKAVMWAQKAASAGNGGAMYLLAGFYRDGRGVTADDSQAYKWFSLARWKGSQADADIAALEKRMTPEAVSDAKRAALWQMQEKTR